MSTPDERLRQSRARAGYQTGTAAAQAFGWAVSTYLGHENGSRGLTKEAADRYAKAFGVSWTWLLGADEPFDDVVRLLTGIPVKGLLDPGAYRSADFRTVDMPDEIYVQMFGYNTEELEAFKVYGSEDHHFIIAAHKGMSLFKNGDELIVRRKLGERFETAAWKYIKRKKGADLEAAYASHVQIDRESAEEFFEESDFEVLGVVVGELRIKRRVQDPPTPFDD